MTPLRQVLLRRGFTLDPFTSNGRSSLERATVVLVHLNHIFRNSTRLLPEGFRRAVVLYLPPSVHLYAAGLGTDRSCKLRASTAPINRGLHFTLIQIP